MRTRIIFFFFSSRRRHTRSYGDWSSDVCSSDLERDDTIGTNNVTLTCATPGSGLVATAAVLDMVTVIARGDVATGLVLDGSQAGDSPLFALNDGVTAFAQDVQFTNNTVTCARFGECVFVAGGTGLVVSD